MTELSPAARAVLTAVTLTKYDVPPEGLPAFAEEMAPLLAAALRAAAYQVHQRDEEVGFVLRTLPNKASVTSCSLSLELELESQ
jgi:hypothetical protein